MKRGDKLIVSEEGKEQGFFKNWRNIICYSEQPNANGVITIERDGIMNPNKRARDRAHKSFFMKERAMQLKTEKDVKT